MTRNGWPWPGSTPPGSRSSRCRTSTTTPSCWPAPARTGSPSASRPWPSADRCPRRTSRRPSIWSGAPCVRGRQGRTVGINHACGLEHSYRGAAPMARFGRPAAVASLLAMTFALAGFALPLRAAATLTQVSGFGSNPGALRMYSYVPAGLPGGSPVVVALHGCAQSASDYYGHIGWSKYAEAYHAALIFPEQASANNPLSCFNWYVAGDIARGQGEALSIKQMVDYAVTRYGSDRHRVYVTGFSAGGAMAAVMLATYPDVFAGGAIIAGLPYNCGTICQYQPQNKTPAQWGDLVRAAYPGFSGPWPRVSIWYGASDT